MSITNDQIVSNKMSPMTHNKLKKRQFFLKTYCLLTGAVAEGQQISDNFHRPMLHRHKKPLHQ